MRLSGRPAYGTIGLVALLLSLIVETLGPLVAAVGYIFFTIGFLTGALSVSISLSFFFVSVSLGSVVSAVAVFGEVVTYREYDEPMDVLVLLWHTLLEDIVYRPAHASISWFGLWDYLSNDLFTNTDTTWE